MCDEERDLFLVDKLSTLNEFELNLHKGQDLIVKCFKCQADCLITPAGRKVFDPGTMDPICPDCFSMLDEPIRLVVNREIEDEVRADAFKYVHRN